MTLLWAILFLVIALILGATALTGIAVAMSFFTKVLLFSSFICFCISLILIILSKIKQHSGK